MSDANQRKSHATTETGLETFKLQTKGSKYGNVPTYLPKNFLQNIALDTRM